MLKGILTKREHQVFERLILNKTTKEIADELALAKKQIKNWVNRYNHRCKKMAAGITPKPKDRPRKYPLDSKSEYEHEIARLQMENKLLRDFLQSIERK